MERYVFGGEYNGELYVHGMARDLDVREDSFSLAFSL